MSTRSQEKGNSCSTKEKRGELVFRILEDVRADHAAICNFCRTISSTDGTFFQGSDLVNLENCYFSDGSTRQAGLLHQPFTFSTELPSDLLEWEDIVTEPKISSVQELTSFQDLNDIQSVPAESNDIIVNNIMAPPTANGIIVSQSSIPGIQIPGYRATGNDQPVLRDFEQLLQDMEQSMQSCQFQATMFNSMGVTDERIFENKPCTGGSVGRTLADDEIDEFIMENTQLDITMTIVASKWVKMIAVARVWKLYRQVSSRQKNCTFENLYGRLRV